MSTKITKRTKIKKAVKTAEKTAISHTCQICGTTMTADDPIVECCACGANALTTLHEPLVIDADEDISKLIRVCMKAMTSVLVIGAIAITITCIVKCIML